MAPCAAHTAAPGRPMVSVEVTQLNGLQQRRPQHRSHRPHGTAPRRALAVPCSPPPRCRTPQALV
ncbi:hypothetical protein HU200_033384 [Digitaria exilis]|uniref:Uncharacterized protein n=1 Tax=Digitaria exilis TaxID=1010633 RepID=A0A835BLL1_9POAL|nr:hypothetical protein HU200_033384 [Digitaria exilis]